MKLLVLTFVLFSFCPVGGQERYSVVIHELMADPSPAVGLPSSEWIEVMNRSKETVNLQGWRIADRTGISGPLPAYRLAPDSMLVICATGSLNAMSAFGPAVAVSSFPSLDNDNDLLVLLSATGVTIHAVQYDVGWYRNDLKKDGGWSLEMIDAAYPCTAINNWTSCVASTGGTPGSENSVKNNRPDTEPPVLLRAYTINDSTIRLVFNETLDSLKASLITAYNSSDVRSGEAFPIAPHFNEVQLHLLSPMTPGSIYKLTASQGCDCAGNITGEQSVKAGIPAALRKDALVINEILFNPVPSGYDYIELYNAGDSVLDLAQGYLTNRNSAGEVAGHVPLSVGPRLIFPGDYYVLTGDPALLQLHFFYPPEAQVNAIPSMPSYPDDKGIVIIAGTQGELIDEVTYSAKWHFPLIRNDEGVALERVDAAKPSNEALSWHSAASTTGYGTPGYRNSQSVTVPGGEGMITIQPKVFSPDSDGLDDLCFVHFNLPAAGFVAQVIIYNLQGIAVRKLVQGGLTGASGYWTWDGLDEKGQANPPGPYIILTSLFDLEGRTRKSKSVVILASK